MDFNLLFTIIIYFIISIFTYFIIKVYTDTITINKKAEQANLNLQSNYLVEEKKQLLNTQNIILVDDLNKSLSNCHFEIAKQLILIQKLIFKKGCI